MDEFKEDENALNFYEAIEKNSFRLCSDLIKFGYAIKTIDVAGSTLLHYASSLGHLRLIQLLAPFSNIDKKDRKGRTSFYSAVVCRQKEAALLLLNLNACVNTCDEDGRTPLHVVASDADVDLAKELVTRGANINCVDLRGRPPLFFALHSGKFKIAEALVYLGADVDALLPDSFQHEENHLCMFKVFSTLTARAVEYGLQAEVEFLVQAGAKVYPEMVHERSHTDGLSVSTHCECIIFGFEKYVSVSSGLWLQAQSCYRKYPFTVALKTVFDPLSTPRCNSSWAHKFCLSFLRERVAINGFPFVFCLCIEYVPAKHLCFLLEVVTPGSLSRGIALCSECSRKYRLRVGVVFSLQSLARASLRKHFQFKFLELCHKYFLPPHLNDFILFSREFDLDNFSLSADVAFDHLVERK